MLYLFYFVHHLFQHVSVLYIITWHIQLESFREKTGEKNGEGESVKMSKKMKCAFEKERERHL